MTDEEFVNTYKKLMHEYKYLKITKNDVFEGLRDAYEDFILKEAEGKSKS